MQSGSASKATATAATTGSRPLYPVCVYNAVVPAWRMDAAQPSSVAPSADGIVFVHDTREGAADRAWLDDMRAQTSAHAVPLTLAWMAARKARGAEMVMAQQKRLLKVLATGGKWRADATAQPRTAFAPLRSTEQYVAHSDATPLTASLVALPPVSDADTTPTDGGIVLARALPLTPDGDAGVNSGVAFARCGYALYHVSESDAAAIDALADVAPGSIVLGYGCVTVVTPDAWRGSAAETRLFDFLWWCGARLALWQDHALMGAVAAHARLHDARLMASSGDPRVSEYWYAASALADGSADACMLWRLSSLGLDSPYEHMLAMAPCGVMVGDAGALAAAENLCDDDGRPFVLRVESVDAAAADEAQERRAEEWGGMLQTWRDQWREVSAAQHSDRLVAGAALPYGVHFNVESRTLSVSSPSGRAIAVRFAVPTAKDLAQAVATARKSGTQEIGALAASQPPPAARGTGTAADKLVALDTGSAPGLAFARTGMGVAVLVLRRADAGALLDHGGKGEPAFAAGTVVPYPPLLLVVVGDEASASANSMRAAAVQILRSLAFVCHSSVDAHIMARATRYLRLHGGDKIVAPNIRQHVLDALAWAGMNATDDAYVKRQTLLLSVLVKMATASPPPADVAQ